MKSKKELLIHIGQSVQRSGTLNVIHTNAIADNVGLSATEFEAQDIITRHQPMSAGELARSCGLTTGAITGIIDRLERAGFVRRQSDPADRRRVLLEPIEDPAINQKIRTLYNPILEQFETIMMSYDAHQLEVFLEIQNKLNDMTENVINDMRRK